MDNDKLQLFENKAIRTAWDEEKEEWYFSIVDVVAVLTDSPNPQTYWRVMKKRLKDEGNETVTNCNAFENDRCRWEKAVDRRCDNGTAFAYHSVYPLTESRAV